MTENEYLKGFKAQLFPTYAQQEYIEKCICINNFVYNWTIQFTNNLLKEEPFIVKSGFSAYVAQVSKAFTEMRSQNIDVGSIPWKIGFGGAKRCMKAFKRHFQQPFQMHLPKKKSDKNPYPYSFDCRNARFHINNNFVKIEGLDSMIQMKWFSDYKYSDKGFHDITISRDNFNQYWVSYSRIFERDYESYFGDIPILERAIG